METKEINYHFNHSVSTAGITFIENEFGRPVKNKLNSVVLWFYSVKPL